MNILGEVKQQEETLFASAAADQIFFVPEKIDFNQV